MSWSQNVLRACLYSLALLSTALAAEYQVIDLGANTQVNTLDDQGMVVGTRVVLEQTPAGEWRTQHAVRLQPLMDLGAPAGVDFPSSDGQAFSGETVVGNAAFQGILGPQAFVWTAAMGYQQLGRLPDQFYSGATGVNAVETISGQALTLQGTGSTTVPVAWVSRVPQILPLLTQTRAAFEGSVEAMHETGDMVGHARTAANDEHAVLWPVEGGIRDLDGRPGHQSFGYALNSRQTVVGDADGQGFVWQAATGLQLLPPLQGLQPGITQLSQALAVNDEEMIVGWHSRRTVDTLGLGPTRAVRWRAGQIVDLNTLIDAPGWVLERATVINTAGTIGGTGTFQGERHAFLLTPVSLAVAAAPVAFVGQVTLDVNQDGWPDKAGVGVDSRIYLGIAGEAWRELPGRAVELAVVDAETGMGQVLIARAADSSLWRLTAQQNWSPTYGNLVSLASGDFFGTGQHMVIGVSADSALWLAPRIGAWSRLNGNLRQLTAGDFLGNGRDQVAGVGHDSSIWFTEDLQQWRQLPGSLWDIAVEPGSHATIIGVGYDGSRWRSAGIGHWIRVN